MTWLGSASGWAVRLSLWPSGWLAVFPRSRRHLMIFFDLSSGQALPRGRSPRHAPAFEPLMVVEAQHEQQVPDPSLGDFGEELDFGVDDDTLMRLLEDPMDEVDCFRASPMAASPAPMTRAPAPAPAPAISIAPAVPTVTKPPLVPIAPLLPMPCVAPGVGPLLLPKAEPGTMLQVPAHLAIPPHLLAAMPAALAAQAAAASGQPQMVRMVKDIAPMPMIVDPTAGAGLVGVKRKEDSLSPAPTTLYSYTEGGSMAEVETKESKKQKRLIRNRMSAQLHRERQKAHVDQLQAQLKEKVRWWPVDSTYMPIGSSTCLEGGKRRLTVITWSVGHGCRMRRLRG